MSTKIYTNGFALDTGAVLERPVSRERAMAPTTVGVQGSGVPTGWSYGLNAAFAAQALGVAVRTAVTVADLPTDVAVFTAPRSGSRRWSPPV